MAKVSFCGVELKAPTVLASGILGNNFEILKRVHEAGCAMVTMKSIGPKPRDGHNNPTVLDWGHGIINAVGLPTPGYSNMEHEWAELSKRDFPLIASIYGSSEEEYAEVAKFVAAKKPDFLEVNISCPNTKSEGMIFGVDEQSSYAVIKAVKAVAAGVPVIAKLTPQAPNIGKIAKACESAGADAICAINTLGPGMVIDIDSGKPILQFKTGGISGPAILPIAVRCVYDIYAAVKIPIIGLGGVTTASDALQMFMAGATLIGIGSGIYYEGPEIFSKVMAGVDSWLKEKGLEYQDLIGLAHKDESCTTCP